MINITFIGLGKLGLPFSLLIEKSGYNILGVDINEKYVESLNDKTFTYEEPYVNDMLKNSKNYNATTDLKKAVKFSDYIYILVNSSVTLDSYYDMTNVSNILSKIKTFSKKTKNIIICSTLEIGYINKVGKYLLNDYNLKHNIAYCPEIVRIGKIIEDITYCNFPFIVGVDNDSLFDFIENLLKKICNKKPDIHRMLPISAEIAKLASNCFKTIKISFANMIGDLSDTVGAEKNIIMNALNSDKNINKGCFIPGYGYGGPCFPRDNKILSYYLKKNNIHSDLIESSDNFNNFHTIFQSEQFLKKNKDKYIFDNLCYRKDCPVAFIEQSQKLKVAELIANKNKKVVIRDNNQIINLIKNKYGNIFQYEIIP